MKGNSLAEIYLPKEAREWLKRGERGLSSEQIFESLTGLPIIEEGCRDCDEPYHPWDPDDLRRCELLLMAVPDFRQRFGEMAHVSLRWQRLVTAWPALIKMFFQEAPDWPNPDVYWRAPKTFNMMKKVLGETA